jgi:hypothetical protein
MMQHWMLTHAAVKMSAARDPTEQTFVRALSMPASSKIWSDLDFIQHRRQK